MLKGPNSMNEFERVRKALESILKEIPIIKLESVEVEAQMGRHHTDVLVHLIAEKPASCTRCKSSRVPARYVRTAFSNFATISTIPIFRQYRIHSTIPFT